MIHGGTEYIPQSQFPAPALNRWDMFTYGALSFMLFLVLFVALRAFMLWYWRVNEIADDLSAIRKKLCEDEDEEKPDGEAK